MTAQTRLHARLSNKIELLLISLRRTGGMRLSERRLAEISIKLDLKADMSLEVHLSIVSYCGVDMLFNRHTCTKGGNLPFMYLHVRN